MANVWRKAMVWLGLADSEEYAEYPEYEEPDARGGQPGNERPAGHASGAPFPPSYDANSGAVRTLNREEQSHQPPPPEREPFQSSAVRTIPAHPAARLHVMSPDQFEDGAREVGDRFKARAPVIMNLSGTSPAVAKRLVDFSAGLAYGLGGRMRKVSAGVFLLTPQGVDVSAEEKRRLREATGILFDDEH